MGLVRARWPQDLLNYMVLRSPLKEFMHCSTRLMASGFALAVWVFEAG